MRTTAVCLGLMVLISCTDRSADKRAARATDSLTQAAETVPRMATDNSQCPATGLWAVCSVEKRLKQSGFVAQKNDSVLPAIPGFSVTPAVYTLNHSRLQLYFYTDAAALSRDVSRLDTAAVAPVFIRAGNLAALLFTDDATQAERVSLALTAGAPGPAR